jgi:surfeit locus 1 family protein
MKPPAGYIWHRPTPVTWIAITLTVLALLSLGTWQIGRMQWKEALIADIEQANITNPREGWPSNPEEAAALGWRRVQVEGHFLHNHEFHVAARYYRSQLGYHILTPFQLEDGRVLVLNRGWVPLEKKEPATRAEGQEEGPLSLIVQVRTDNDRNFFTPDADASKNIWFWRDIPRMQNASGLKLEPVTADVLHAAPPGGYPIASDGEVKLRNDHLGYVITWFSLALAAVVIFTLYHLRPEKESV